MTHAKLCSVAQGVIILASSACSFDPTPVAQATPDDRDCIPPPTWVFTSTGYSFDVVDFSWDQLESSGFKFGSDPALLMTISESARDEQVRKYYECRAINDPRNSPEMRTYLEALLFPFLGTGPSPDELMEWQSKNPPPNWLLSQSGSDSLPNADRSVEELLLREGVKDRVSYERVSETLEDSIDILRSQQIPVERLDAVLDAVASSVLGMESECLKVRDWLAERGISWDEGDFSLSATAWRYVQAAIDDARQRKSSNFERAVGINRLAKNAVWLEQTCMLACIESHFRKS